MAERVDDTILESGARRTLIRLAYRLLGSVDEAEDVVQDAHVKLLAVDRAPHDTQAYLFRTVTNLAIDRLRHLKVQRRAYPGPWLPEPLATEAPGADGGAGVADDLSVALLLLLERLSVAERVVFVLREACDLSFAEMADVLGVRREACRQRYHRARRKLAGARRPTAPPALQRRALERLIEAVSAGDSRRLAALLTDDALLLTDGGGRASAAIRPVERAGRIAQVMVHLAARDDHLDVELEFLDLNGGVGLLVTAAGDHGRRYLYASIQVEAVGERVSRIYVVRNPDKLARLATRAHASTEG